MILFNTTFVVEAHAIEMFKKWVKSSFIPAAIESGLLTEPLLTRILPHTGHEDVTDSFALQFKSDNIESAQKWAESTGSELIGEIQKAQNNAILAFSTFMEIL